MSHCAMSPIKRRFVRPKVAAVAAAVALGCSCLASSPSMAGTVACYPAWSSSTNYVAGNEVSQNNENYVANYSSTGSSPATNSGQVGTGDPWIPAFPCNISSGTVPAAATYGPKHALLGYWENWGTITLPDMSTQYQVLLYCFAEGEGTDGSTIFMWTPSSTNPLANAPSDIAAAKAQGRTILLSIGGATSANITLENSTDEAQFVSTTEALVKQYGFQGIDLDFENTSVSVNAGDSLTNPQTPDLVYLIAALRQIHNDMGSNFIISMVPETAYVDAVTSWGGYWGSYLPIIEDDRDIVNIISTQDYNSGNMVGADGNTYGEGTADFEVAMAELLIHGFAISGGQQFTGVNQNQVAMAVEVNVDSPSVTAQAWNYLANGVSYGGSYHLINGPYPNAAGVTIWDACQDAANGYAFADALQAVGCSGATGSSSCSATPSAPTGLSASGTTTSSTGLSWSAVGAPTNCSISGYTLYKNGSSIATTTSTSYSVTGLSASTTYTFTVAASDSDGTGSQSSALDVTTSSASCSAVPGAPGGLSASGTTSSSSSLSWSAVTAPANCSISSYTVYKNGSSIGTTSSTSYAVTGLSASTTYTFTVAATDSDGTGSRSSAVDVTTAATSGSGGIKIACGNTAQGSFVADTDFSGGANSSGTTNSINTSKVINPAPTSVYQHGRKETCTYTIPGLTAGASYSVRLDFCEYAATGAGQRTFDVSINGTQVLTNFDIYATAGGEYIANAQTFSATANGSGQIVMVFTTVVNNVLVAGIEVTPTAVAAGGYTLTPGCAPGTVLDDENNATTNGNPIVIYQENGSTGEEWTIGAAANNGWNMATLGPYCVQASGTTSGSAVELWSCNGAATQDFVAGLSNGGGYNFALYGYSLCMNVTGSGTANNTAVTVSTCNGTSAQQWNLEVD